MAAIAAVGAIHDGTNGVNHRTSGPEDPFTESDPGVQPSYLHRFSSRFELEDNELAAASSPSQVKRILETHLLETERRLQDAHKLGTSLLQQQSELQDKLREVEQQQDDAEISPELKQRLASLGREHDDVSRDIARSLLAPKSRAVSGEEKFTGESTTLTSQATGSPTKISAPNRRSRNQLTNQASDLQFAVDIGSSLLVQVRQLEAAVAERDEALKTANSERSRLEQDVQIFSHRIRSHDESEQKYKDETWNLEAQNHELLSSQREAAEREKKLSTSMAMAIAEKTRLLGEIEESRLAHNKAMEDREAAKKAHETEMHVLKRDFDAADMERLTLQNKIDELTAQNQEFAQAMASRYRDQSPQRQPEFGDEEDELSKDFSTPEHSPPPSPTKATPRHGGLESETLKSSLHHAHRMIQNLKSNIHREKTDKIELKRMLQDARDELEQRRNDSSLGSGTKKPKTRNEMFKKPARPDMLGGSRRTKTDVEIHEDEWEDQGADLPRQPGYARSRPALAGTDLSDAYQTAHETESNFETADERHTTESEAFETGVESLAGDSTDELTETESTAPHPSHRSSGKYNRPSLAFRSAGARDSYLSTASTSAGEEDEETQTPVQPQLSRFKLRNSRTSSMRQTQIFEGTPDSVRTQVTSHDSPATVTSSRSPPGVEQSLFTELEGINDTGSNFSTPARSGLLDLDSTPGVNDTPSKLVSTAVPVPVSEKPTMVDSAMMTEPWQPESVRTPTNAVPVHEIDDSKFLGASTPLIGSRAVSIGDFPLPPNTSAPVIQHVDTGTQYTPQKSLAADMQSTPQGSFEQSTQYTPSRTLHESPIRGDTNFITPPRTVWDAEHESEMGSPDRNVSGMTGAAKPILGFSGMLAQDSAPMSPPRPAVDSPVVLAYSTILSQQTHPIAPPPSLPPTGPLPALPIGAKQEQSNTGKAVAAGAATGGILAGAAAALGLSSWSKDRTEVPHVVEDETSGLAETSAPVKETPLRDISGNAVLRRKQFVDSDLKDGAPVTVSHQDSSSQTMLTAEEIERALQARKKSAVPPIVAPPTADVVSESTAKTSTRSTLLTESHSAGNVSTPTSPPLRPSSASSTRPSTASKQYPPLPPDFKTNIARANSQVQSSVSKKEPSTQAVGTVMGPPLMPASAMRRPKTPAESTRSPSRENATPRISRSTRQHEGAESQLSRRSSVSSFASELDERFNIRTAANGYEPTPGTDPRMIQAITQTMIGEYLWKYTRKPGSKEMSSTRHKRYFWVHPYTKTLYWSTTDPSLPGAKEGTSRSVPIESIRVLTDDNPMPPGLHRKSLEVTTPSRKLKFTASTGQRHETWFNALSYLLLRGEAPDTQGAYSTGGNEITRDDIDEFRVTGHDPRLVPNSRQSMSSYNSRTTTGTSKRVSNTNTSQRQALPTNIVRTNSGQTRPQNSLTRNDSMPLPTTSGRSSRADQQHDAIKDRNIRASSVSRVSGILRSMTGRTSRQDTYERAESQQAEYSRGPSRNSNSIYDASVVPEARDSAEEARQEMLKQEAQGLGNTGGLENVRACCDGKHDVSTLPHTQRYSERSRTLSSMSDRINRSMSKRV